MHLPGSLDCAQERAGLVHALLVLALRVGVGNNTRSRLNISPAAMHDHGADGDAGVEIAGVIGIEDGSAINTATNRLKLFDDLHSANLGSASQRARWKTRGHGIEGVELAAKLAFQRRDEVHD